MFVFAVKLSQSFIKAPLAMGTEMIMGAGRLDWVDRVEPVSQQTAQQQRKAGEASKAW